MGHTYLPILEDCGCNYFDVIVIRVALCGFSETPPNILENSRMTSKKRKESG
jgi:hypothetical protein